jgi:hypothetical protein
MSEKKRDAEKEETTNLHDRNIANAVWPKNNNLGLPRAAVVLAKVVAAFP